MSLKVRLAENLRLLRNDQGLTQIELSKISGISLSYIGFIENCRTSATIDVLEKLAKSLNTDPCILLAKNQVKIEGSGAKAIKLIPTILEEGEAAFAFWTPEGMEFHPFEKNSIRNVIRNLSFLQANGISGKDIFSKFIL